MLYKKIDPNSGESLSNALDVFGVSPTNVAFSDHHWRQYLTLNPVNTPPYHFKVHSSSSFLDLTKTFLVTQMRIWALNDQGAKAAIPPNANVAPIQMIGSTFIKNLKISINNQEVYDSNSLYAYKAYLDTELSFGREAKSSWLQSSGYFLDESLNQNDVQGAGFVARKELFSGSRVVELVSRLNCDLFNQPKLMIPHVEIDIELTPNSDNFLVHAPGVLDADRYVVEIVDCRLMVKALEIMDSLSLEFNQKLDKTPATYNVRKSVIKPIFISAGRFEFNGLLDAETVPRRVTLALVGNDAFNGRLSLSPFKFKPFNLREISIHTMGKQVPTVPYNLDYPNGRYIRAYNDMMDSLGFLYTQEGNAITRKMYGTQWTIYTFNLTNSGEDEPNFELVKNACTNVNVKFATAVPANGIILIVYMESDGIVMVDRNRSLSTDNTL